MKVNSDHAPEQFTKSKGKLFFNYNIVESEKTDENGTRTVFDYDSVEVKNKDKNTIIAAIMQDNYSIDEELALINNKFKLGEVDPEYEGYQSTRDSLQLSVSGILAETQEEIDAHLAAVEARETFDAARIAKAQAYIDNLPSWSQVKTNINNITDLAGAKAFLTKLARVVYWGVKNTEL
jgi:hypothetical protein